MDDQWSSDFYVGNILFSQLSTLASHFSDTKDWPTLSDFNQLMHGTQGNLESLYGASLKFVDQGEKTSNPDESYEARIYLKGEIQTRSRNWHDFFQVLIWCTYSQTKRLINKMHYLALAERASNKKSSRRSNIENTLTLFDECGAVVVSSNPELLELIKEFKWSELFLHRRDCFESEIKCFIFGHALYEKCLTPYIGMTAHSLCLTVDKSFFPLNDKEQKKQVDDLASGFFNEHDHLTPRVLDPLPVLGIPGWDSRNNDPDFYLNKEYFREKRRLSP
jgi:hypothetical protein